MFILGILIILSFLAFYNHNAINDFFNSIGKTSPEAITNYTHGEFTIKEHKYQSFENYYSQVKPIGEKNLHPEYSESKINYTLEVPKLEYDYKFYDYEPEYYEFCKGKKIEINFSESNNFSFEFNYSDKIFNYKINLFQDLYSFSDNLKNQDCYFSSEKYTEGFLEDPYNNNFIDIISKNFISLKKEGYSEDEIIEIATLFVQSIPYGSDVSNRYPYETLYENEGNCLDKSLILSGILKNLNYTSYIILGESEDEYHALVGIVCKEGNINYDNQEICLIETTIYTPISSEIKIEIEEYIKTSSGTRIYEGVNYGKGLINYFDKKYSEVEKIELELKSIESQLIEIENKMCTTDCVICSEDSQGNQFVDWQKSNAFISSCWDAQKYNTLVNQYNNKIEEHNSLVENWYKPYYDLEKSMFGNIELIQRNQNFNE